MFEYRNAVRSFLDENVFDAELNIDGNWIPVTIARGGIYRGHELDELVDRIIADDNFEVEAGPTQEEIDADATAAARSHRDYLLYELDKVVSNPLRWPSLDQEAWTTYRQALLDVPQQEGFPHEVEWPDAPTA